jgi:hypothetical protein
MVSGKCIQIYKNKFIHKNKNKNKNKVVVFDMDETLGCFTDLEALWNVIETENLSFSQPHLNRQDRFNSLFDLYPEFLRYGIANVLEYLYYKKQCCDFIGVYIYTNNQVNKRWSKMIINYLEKINKIPGLFNQIINAFKINKRIIEPLRNSNTKTHGDFIRCSVLPYNTELCFIDNTYYSKMHHNKIYYIQPKPFFHGLKTGDIIQRLMDSSILKTKTDKFFMSHFLENNLITTVEKSQKTIIEDTFVSRKILYHIQDFFLMTTRNKNTRKNKKVTIGNFTRKRRT